MKKLLFTLGLFSLLAVSVMAQKRGGERQTAEQRAERATEKMAEELGLSDEQKAEILELNLQFAQEREEERKASREAREEMRKSREEMREKMQAQDEKIKAVLTEEQAAKWEEIKKERRESGERRSPRPRRGGGIE